MSGNGKKLKTASSFRIFSCTGRSPSSSVKSSRKDATVQSRITSNQKNERKGKK